ncbi:LuxR C-terminal-related transcriptional regulator [Altererythrobacter sp. Root672]|uniref:LuxR C-terminal-related transcriptional regulator n=1 Tax=Altererythrobacter sp. Root672 TaxID=1736584 RepID=UPI0006F9C535|nr:LuxR C-terminal-related transcriptional regulator [Altererythrobacter sp. Root672]KRA83644.1 histidine kinase [Altererythrobacter sp. Root672]
MSGSADLDDLLRSLCNSPIATVVTNPRAPDNPIVGVNEAFTRLTGYAASEAIGRNCRFLAGGHTRQAGTSILREAIVRQRPVLTELLNYRQDQTPFRNAVMIAPLFDGEGRLEYFIGSQMEVGGGDMPSVARKEASRELINRLTPRQRQVLGEMILGYRNKQIAARLGLSEKTVKMHRSLLLERLGAISSMEAVRIAVEAGI